MCVADTQGLVLPLIINVDGSVNNSLLRLFSLNCEILNTSDFTENTVAGGNFMFLILLQSLWSSFSVFLLLLFCFQKQTGEYCIEPTVVCIQLMFEFPRLPQKKVYL